MSEVLARSRAVVSGARAAIDAARDHINDQNVYPVPDGDTGTNLALTVAAVDEALAAADDGDTGGGGDARPAVGADGRPWQLRDHPVADRPRPVRRPGHGSRRVRGVAGDGAAGRVGRRLPRGAPAGRGHDPDRDPRDGDRRRGAAGTGELRAAVLAAGEDAVARTPELLAVLRDAGVVDAGGAGLLEIVRGAFAGLSGEELAPAARAAARRRGRPPRRAVAVPLLHELRRLRPGRRDGRSGGGADGDRRLADRGRRPRRHEGPRPHRRPRPRPLAGDRHGRGGRRRGGRHARADRRPVAPPRPGSGRAARDRRRDRAAGRRQPRHRREPRRAARDHRRPDDEPVHRRHRAGAAGRGRGRGGGAAVQRERARRRPGRRGGVRGRRPRGGGAVDPGRAGGAGGLRARRAGGAQRHRHVRRGRRRHERGDHARGAQRAGGRHRCPRGRLDGARRGNRHRRRAGHRGRRRGGAGASAGRRTGAGHGRWSAPTTATKPARPWPACRRPTRRSSSTSATAASRITRCSWGRSDRPHPRRHGDRVRLHGRPARRAGGGPVRDGAAAR